MLSVVVPTYNEKDNVRRLLRLIDESLRGVGVEYEVVVVDDNSPDGTADVVRSLSGEYPVRLVVRRGRMGLSSAVLDGIRKARGGVVAVMDADLQHPPRLLPELYERVVKGYDIVVASRYVKGGSVKGWGLYRRLVSRVATVIARALLPEARRVKDPMSGFFAIRREVVEGVRLNPQGFKILLEILVKGRYNRVCEIPYEFRPREAGESKLGAAEMINYLLHVVRLSVTAAKFASVGGIGVLVNLLVVHVLASILGLPHELAAALAIEASIVNNFLLHEAWTFKRLRKEGGLGGRLAKYHLSTAAGVLVQYLTSIAVYRALVGIPVVAQLTGIVTGFLVNYLLSTSVVWPYQLEKLR